MITRASDLINVADVLHYAFRADLNSHDPRSSKLLMGGRSRPRRSGRSYNSDSVLGSELQVVRGVW